MRLSLAVLEVIFRLGVVSGRRGSRAAERV
jgi:hypothetical protein